MPSSQLDKKWEISVSHSEGEPLPARAGIGSDGEMMWVVMGAIAPPRLCTTYRTLFVLAKEPNGWRIVHHHYSQGIDPD